MQYQEVKDPTPGPGEVLIAVRACGVNRIDIWVRQALPGVALPHIEGSEFAGEIAALGPGVEGWRVGDRVLVYNARHCGRCEWCLAGEQNACCRFGIIGWVTDGGYAEFAAVPARNCLPLPPHISWEVAGAFPLTFLTSWHMLVTRAGIRAGETVLVQAAGSGIGVAAVQIAKLAGCRVIATAGSDEKLRRITELGADAGINYAHQSVPDEVKRLTEGRGVDVVFEHVGPATWEGSLKSLAKKGRIVTCGATTGPTVSVELRPFYTAQQTVLGSVLGTIRELAEVTRLVAEGKLRPVIDTVFPLKEAAVAQRRMLDRNLFGKLLLQP